METYAGSSAASALPASSSTAPLSGSTATTHASRVGEAAAKNAAPPSVVRSRMRVKSSST